MRDSTEFEIVVLPTPSKEAETNPRWTTIARKFRELRLYALKTAPEAFASSYEVESQRGLDQTWERLRNAKAAQFIALSDKRSTDGPDFFEIDLDRAAEEDWIGMIVLLGPAGDSTSEAVSARVDPISRMTEVASIAEEKMSHVRSVSSACLHYHLNGVFVSPSARRAGLGKALIRAAIQRAESETRRQHKGLRLTVLVDSENFAARKLYERMGFQVFGEETYNQQPRAALGESVEKQRNALQMELRVESS